MENIIGLIIRLIGVIIIGIGVFLIYDARNLAKKRFSFGDQNEGSKTLKIIGFVISIIGGIIVISQI